MTASDRIACDVRDATAISGLARSRLYELMKEGRVERIKDGKKTLILVESLRAYLESLRATDKVAA